jgi:hypothetical protein
MGLVTLNTSSILGQILDKHTCISFLIDFSLSLLLVFILTNAVNLISHKYVENSVKTGVVLAPVLRYFLVL